MYFFLILFFISLIGIVFMVGRKLMLLDNTGNVYIEEITIETIDLDKVKNKTLKHVKKYGFMLLIITLRLSIRSSHLIKEGYKKTKHQTKEFVSRMSNKNKSGKNREVSNFLKMVSDYKERIKEIKDKIKEEEGIN